jgi:alpha-tubulin N-acetyltransferase 1
MTITKLTPESKSSTGWKTTLDRLGVCSAEAQGLLTPITSWAKFSTSRSEVMYVYCPEGARSQPTGFIRMGRKRLYLSNGSSLQQCDGVLCVLDFYTNQQRQGIGEVLFQGMLEGENETPGKLAYDRPSVKLKSFLRKHFALHDECMQHNHFMIFPQFWSHH